jgi:hypothetical protein
VWPHLVGMRLRLPHLMFRPARRTAERTGDQAADGLADRNDEVVAPQRVRGLSASGSDPLV